MNRASVFPSAVESSVSPFSIDRRRQAQFDKVVQRPPSISSLIENWQRLEAANQSLQIQVDNYVIDKEKERVASICQHLKIKAPTSAQLGF